MKKKEHRTTQFLMRMKPTEKELVEKAAEYAGETTSGWIRRVALAAARKELKS